MQMAANEIEKDNKTVVASTIETLPTKEETI
jgi:hypothetical protein